MKVGYLNKNAITFILLLTVFLFSCTSKATQNVKFNEHGVYQAKTIKEASSIVGFPISTINQLPKNYQEEPIISVSKLQSMKNVPMRVEQTWKNNVDENQYIILIIDKINKGIGDASSELIQLGGKRIQKQLIQDANGYKVLTLFWVEDGISYVLSSTITDLVTEEDIINLAETIN